MVVGVAAVDDHVVAFEERDEGFSVGSTTAAGTIIQTARGFFSFLREVFERRRPDRPLFGERLHGFRMEVVNDALVTGPQQAPHHVGSHPAQSDHAQFHATLPSLQA